jgi:crotonobetaine/carnitine-CoA ligase
MADVPTTLGELIAQQSARHGEKPCIFFEDRVISFAGLEREVNRAARALAALGVGPGVGVAMMVSNCPEFLFVYYAVQKLGAYTVPINVALKGEGLQYIIDHSDSSVVVVDHALVDSIEHIAGGLPKLRHRVVHDAEAPAGWQPPAGWLRLTDLVRGQSDAPLPTTVVEGELSALMYTSGTTGRPKGVAQRHRRVPLVPAAGSGPEFRADDVLYCCLPLFHANALGLSARRALTLGVPMALARRFSASRLWDDCRRYGCTSFNALGAMIPILMKQPERPDDRDNPVRIVVSAACPASVWRAFEKRFDIVVHEFYGAVDGGGFSVANPPGVGPPGSFGRPTAPYRIVGDDGNDVPPGQPGELWWKLEGNATRRVEYYKNPEASSAKTAGGWLHTGDVVRVDEQGFMFFVDRKTESLRRRGENISSYEVERDINKHPAVLESAVFGVPSELGEDDVMAVVVLKPGQSVTPEALIEHCEREMAYFMVPRYLEFRDELPKTGTHRTQKGALKSEGVGPATWDREKHRKGK